ncbi:paraquat-inducible protein A [Gilvimarinus sp. DA14]|uniref:paraquat-inducible protein A n=1 Tax=Gilvimarinus sp. DA14 TaxID=2956798 RepID=UPI0020B8C75E|nr:paraquat-inducible protein A [Gilvimarinus sp. DA14]UTF61293.1 paraquat-inducible protein A [Gilvimarinus sp. DA14]
MQKRPKCPRCGSALPGAAPLNPSIPMALALAGLIIAIPTHVYPQMSFGLVGAPNTYTLLGGAWRLMDMGFVWVGALVLLCTAVAPVFLLAVVFATCSAWFLGARVSLIHLGLKLYHRIAPWVMLDVYLLAVIVSMVKLVDMGSFEISTGFICFLCLLVLLGLTMGQFNTDRFWDLTERQHARD